MTYAIAEDLDKIFREYQQNFLKVADHGMNYLLKHVKYINLTLIEVALPCEYLFHELKISGEEMKEFKKQTTKEFCQLHEIR